MSVVEMKPDISIMPARMPLAESQRVIYAAIVTEEVTREDLLEPSFWKHVAPKLKSTYRIEVINDTYDFFAEYLVIDAGHNWAVVEELRFVELGQHKQIENDNQQSLFKVVQKGPHLKFCVVRLKDNVVIKDRMGKEEAQTFLKEHLKTLERTG
jgi:hypothetical protein